MMKKMQPTKKMRIALVLVAVGALVACGGSKKGATPPVLEIPDAGVVPIDAGPPPPKNLYEKIGGKEKVGAVVESTMKGASEHPKLKKIFAKTTGARLEAYKKNLGDFLCRTMDGECKYDGKDMRVAHKGMNVSEAQWEAFIEVFTKALADNGVSDDDQNKIIDLVTPMHDDVLNKSVKK